jgi:hypothetical protein
MFNERGIRPSTREKEALKKFVGAAGAAVQFVCQSEHTRILFSLFVLNRCGQHGAPIVTELWRQYDNHVLRTNVILWIGIL